ncbi:DUF2716 domain-containing protein [Micromonospora sp. NPDC047753]|uniref:DUF2716 domain-containing protein n=1 Tax=Micromonospora sp. NPDC047753 TaxID=3154817 RepID=UPI0033FC67D3
MSVLRNACTSHGDGSRFPRAGDCRATGPGRSLREGGRAKLRSGVSCWTGSTRAFGSGLTGTSSARTQRAGRGLSRRDYYAFLTEDMTEGTFGHPWEQTLCVFGSHLMPKLVPLLSG